MAKKYYDNIPAAQTAGKLRAVRGAYRPTPPRSLSATGQGQRPWNPIADQWRYAEDYVDRYGLPISSAQRLRSGGLLHKTLCAIEAARGLRIRLSTRNQKFVREIDKKDILRILLAYRKLMQKRQLTVKDFMRLQGFCRIATNKYAYSKDHYIVIHWQYLHNLRKELKKYDVEVNQPTQ